MLIARLIADPDTLGDNLALAMEMIEARGWDVAGAGMLDFCDNVVELELVEGDPAEVRRILDQCFPDSDLLLSAGPIEVPSLFVSDMDSTMIGQECIDELADFAGLKERIAAITERAMQGELDFESALRERVGLLKDLPEDAIRQCLDERIRPMPGARTLVSTLKARGCHTVLVTGGFHSFADPVAEMLGFERVVGNRLGLHEGVLTGGLVGGIVDSSVKKKVLLEETARLGEGTVSLATGDGANDIPMIEAASFGLAYRAKPKARAAADGWIDRGDLTAILDLLGIRREDWVLD
ncbi:phosphoserine phosphatase SerB [Novosphingobium percolationis]|uniref:phosphoserine phosphatase SerB n=1 Tax=Novosphingobium percolationis TaxID=2871811 RepID=UPI001CD60730|nr:phosphoserine phosphatase SerB [Novosphingobium percolationis]